MLPRCRKKLRKSLLVTLVVTISRRSPAMVVRQRGAPGTSEGVGKMIKSSAGKPSLKTAARFAYAAGATGVLANSLLIAFFALQASHPNDGSSLGSATPTETGSHLV